MIKGTEQRAVRELHAPLEPPRRATPSGEPRVAERCRGCGRPKKPGAECAHCSAEGRR